MSAVNIIEIENLSCSYSRNTKDAVLYIEKLGLPKGKIVFLLGASGSGKSTLLETLGLMNNTIATGTVKLFDNDKLSCDFGLLWKNNNLEEISSIRRHYLSFIFQNTNLMENFTAYENICLSKMIKTNSGQSQAVDGAVGLMKQVGLPLNEVGLDKVSVNLSGGQRQRVSFVRALNNDYKILLCDEPTGNLDEINAIELLKIVKDNIGSERTAIVVSHDINLALKYADQIVLITKNEEKGYGEVLQENIFYRDQWSALDEHALLQFRKQFLACFMSKTRASLELSADRVSDNFKGITYKKLFAKKEGNVLFGKKKINLLILISIISITFIAMGFANGALSYLDTKLKDPFVNWLTVGIPWAKNSSSSVRDITDRLNDQDVRNMFLIDTVTAYKETSLPLFSNLENESEFIKGRLISVDDPISKDIFSEENLLMGDSAFKDDKDLGIVVTKKMLDRLGFPLDSKLIYFDNTDVDTTSGAPVKFKVPIPVRAVVKEIPGRNSFLVTNFFYVSWINKDNCVFDFKAQRKRILFHVAGNRADAKEFAAEIRKMAGNFKLKESVPPSMLEENQLSEVSDEDDDYDSDAGSQWFDDESENISSANEKGTMPVEEVPVVKEYAIDVRYDDTCTSVRGGGYEVSVNFDALPVFYTTTEQIYQSIISSAYFKKHSSEISRIFDYNNAPLLEEEFSNDYVCINFKPNGLDSIEPLARFIFNNLNSDKVKEQTNVIDVDASAVKEKKNFNYISKMTWLISGLLVVFSILSISLFISNLLKTHLNKVKMNLGTYKAFGLSDKESVSIYLGIMLRFIMIGLLSALLVSYIIGNIIGVWFGSILNIDDQVEYFRLFAGQTYFLIFIILVVTVLTSYINITRILSKTPGDLIYNR